jgi:hypothetical protein
MERPRKSALMVRESEPLRQAMSVASVDELLLPLMSSPPMVVRESRPARLVNDSL